MRSANSFRNSLLAGNSGMKCRGSPCKFSLSTLACLNSFCQYYDFVCQLYKTDST